MDFLFDELPFPEGFSENENTRYHITHHLHRERKANSLKKQIDKLCLLNYPESMRCLNPALECDESEHPMTKPDAREYYLIENLTSPNSEILTNAWDEYISLRDYFIKMQRNLWYWKFDKQKRIQFRNIYEKVIYEGNRFVNYKKTITKQFWSNSENKAAFKIWYSTRVRQWYVEHGYVNQQR